MDAAMIAEDAFRRSTKEETGRYSSSFSRTILTLRGRMPLSVF